MSDLNGKSAIVTGGATLIAEKAAEALIKRGASVMLADIDSDGGEAAAQRLGDKAQFLTTDVSDDGQIQRCIDATIESTGRLDILVNVAVTYLDEGLDSSREQWSDALGCNVIGAAIFAQKAVPHMREQGGGAIVNFASISAKIAQPGRMLYSVSKAAMHGMTRNMALQLAPDKIRVNSVSPGWTWSNIMSQLSGDDRAKADGVAAPLHLVGRLIAPEEVASTVAFLCSDDASGITGTDVAVDGGYSAIGPERMENLVEKLMS